MSDHYQTLGVDRGASADEIKKAYRKIARELHPDVNPDPAVQDKFKEVTAAYEVLSDSQKRQSYDMGGSGFGGFGGGFGGGGFSGGQRRAKGSNMRIRVKLTLEEIAAGVEKKINNRMLYNYLAWNYISNPLDTTETFYEEIEI